MHLTKLQRSVVNKARRKLKKKPWYTGVCLDSFKPTATNWLSDYRIKEIGIDNAVQEVIWDTTYWAI